MILPNWQIQEAGLSARVFLIAASKHLAFGYVDFPPFIALLTAFVRLILGDSLLALHLFPALAGAGVIVLTGLMAHRAGLAADEALLINRDCFVHQPQAM